MNKNQMPVHYTNSISLNAKIFDIQHLNCDQLDIIAIGSSMTLNNINSEIITNKLSKKYYNFSAWGMNIAQINNQCRFYVKKYHPKLIICAVTMGEFNKNGIILDSNYSLIFNKCTIIRWLYAGKNISRTIGEYEVYKSYTHDRNYYTSLLYDTKGGVPLDIPIDKINKKRWNEIPNFNALGNQYVELSSLSDYLHKNNIRLVLVQIPYRKDAIDTLNLNPLNEHIDKCRKILDKNGHILFNYAFYKEISSHNEYYTDVTHLNEKGAKILTQQLAHDIDSLGILKR